MLTPAQLATLKAAILAETDLTFVAYRNAGETGLMANWFNDPAAPDFWVWRTSVSKAELTNSTSQDGTTFNWTGAGFITRSVGERDAWRELFDTDGTVNPALPQVRQAFQDIFSGGTPPAPANRTHLATVARRKALRIEALLASGTGSTASPATMGYEGGISSGDVIDALAS